MSVLVLVEHADGAIDELSLQAVAFARSYAGEGGVEAVLVGDAGAAAVLGEHGVGVAHVADLGTDAYAPVAWARAVAQAAQRLGPEAVVAAGSDRGNEVLAHAAVLCDAALAANCTGATPGEVAEVTRLRWGGSLLEHARLHGALKLMTLAPHAVAAEPAAAAAEVEVRPFSPDLEASDLLVQVVERVDTSGGGLSLADAPVVVSGGRGVGSAEGFGPLEELAEALGGVVGCSRAVTMAGWRPHSDQVGQTGTKIAPEIYIPCGISGATQHMAGIKGAKKVLAINADRDAPILMHADYAVVGDLAEIVPAITAELRRVRAAG